MEISGVKRREILLGEIQRPSTGNFLPLEWCLSLRAAAWKIMSKLNTLEGDKLECPRIVSDYASEGSS